MNTRKSFWEEKLETARANPSEWHSIGRRYIEASARQIASDIRNAHKRPTSRIQGVRPGEQWEAKATLNTENYWTVEIRPLVKVDA